ncbi:hypothetical protein [Solitalea canadensis]|uniref:hypothetical protein n=1 Tax=Solitalea canadensis TaxID=995 RepID=UPI0002471D30|nr:hypothetical protein [Solitalea canadensis]
MGDRKIIIWLRGGVTTYFYKSNYSVNPTVYDGVQNPLPYQQTGGPTHTYKTALEPYVNSKGMSVNRNAYFNGTELNYFGGTMGIGTRTPNATLGVNGNIRAKEIKVETANWPDYVFAPTYNLPSLQETEQHIKEKGHLPGIPSAEEVKNNGVDLGEMNAKLLQKIEELTLHLIELKKENESLNTRVNQLENSKKEK